MNSKHLFYVCAVVALPVACTVSRESGSSEISLQEAYPNVLALQEAPATARVTGKAALSAFSDLGAWHAYSLPTHFTGGFSGPFLMTQQNGVWASPSLADLHLTDAATGQPLVLDSTAFEAVYLPGKLVQTYTGKELDLKLELIFISSRSALVRAQLTNKAGANLQASWRGSTWLPDSHFKATDNGVRLEQQKESTIVRLWVPEAGEARVTENKYELQAHQGQQLKKGATVQLLLAQSAVFSEEELAKEQPVVAAAFKNPEEVFEQNTQRWNGYVQQVLPEAKNDTLSRLAVKSLITLTSNWRTPAGELKHAGLFPSYAYRGFHGFWAWDSWKHAVALARFHPELAKGQMRTMYDYQDEHGMIADCIFRDTLIEQHNWRDTKPPLSGWAIHKIYEATNDKAFVEEMLPKLLRYHAWWYAYRDHDQNGLCEYGSTDGTRIAAAWESGMDNAVRFDKAVMLQNNASAWSLNQESVDLNSYLYAEKKYIAQLLQAVGKGEQAKSYLQEAEKLAARIREVFYDAETGYFYDVRLEDKSRIKVMGPEGWLPLWAGLATPEQAAAVQEKLMEPTLFNTHVPFPTLNASHPDFNPRKGYWRGPVWLDQAYFGLQGLRQYGYAQEATMLQQKLLRNSNGLLGNAPLHENYHPVTGERLNAAHFSWSAAHVLMLLNE
ncbi:MGH1-like glycoside hydrolase domain-containing protein [Pontibacter litorisediminis]|uniref:MGH1-like glycoside hydrolase domain-containing protein n=1 Tax=Pontibacter litorisediminis TaxID=1846260 RepID=UPI0023EBDB57|nr:trehalase family glycosidase [Pontibacter litorisediminis]